VKRLSDCSQSALWLTSIFRGLFAGAYGEIPFVSNDRGDLGK
jgi:hypothetical protein